MNEINSQMNTTGRVRSWWKRFTTRPPDTDTCMTDPEGDHDYEWITLDGYNAPSLDVECCRWCGVYREDEHV